jgi:hypothetical protein
MRSKINRDEHGRYIVKCQTVSMSGIPPYAFSFTGDMHTLTDLESFSYELLYLMYLVGDISTINLYKY